MAWHVFIPDSLLEESDDPKIRTYKVGQIARACAIFGVEHVWIYRAGGRDGKFIKTILEYAETPPQYLRKRLFPPLMPELRYVGVIPPLRTPPTTSSRESRRSGGRSARLRLQEGEAGLRRHRAR